MTRTARIHSALLTLQAHKDVCLRMARIHTDPSQPPEARARAFRLDQIATHHVCRVSAMAMGATELRSVEPRLRG